MNLVLVAIHLEPSTRAIPLGPAMLAAAVKQHLGQQVATTLLDCTLQQSAADCTGRILAQQPDAVGLSVTVWNRDMALDIARQLRIAAPQLIVFAGGPEVSADLQNLGANPDLDFLLPGEAEQSLVEALRELLEGRRPAKAGSGARPPQDLGALPSPYLTGLLQPKQGGGALWELSRGCPFRCDFCFESRGSSVVRRFPVDRVRAELELFAEAGASEVFVLDPTFNYHKPTAKRLLRLMAETGQGLHFSLEIRAELLDEELAELFAAIDCSLQIGLQSADPEVLHKIHRDFDPEEFAAKVLLLHEAGVSYGFDLIYGLPGDSLGGFLASLDYALSLAPNHLDIFPLAVLPGTRLADTAAGLGLKYERHNPYRVLSSTTFSAADMQQAARIAAACDFFYNRGRAVPWFAQVLEALGLPPSEFLRRLAAMLPTSLPSDPVPLQRQFLKDQFVLCEQPQIAALAGDLPAYFGYVEALFEVPDRFRQQGPETGLQLNPASCFVAFAHDPQLLQEHLGAGISDLEELAFFVPRVDREYFCWRAEEELHFHPLTAAESAYLKSLATAAPAAEPAAGFVDEALAAGMLLRKG